MTKEDLLKEIKQLEKKMKTLESNNVYLLGQQNVFKKMAEDSGSEAAKWKHDFIRLEEENKKLKVMQK